MSLPASDDDYDNDDDDDTDDVTERSSRLGQVDRSQWSHQHVRRHLHRHRPVQRRFR